MKYIILFLLPFFPAIMFAQVSDTDWEYDEIKNIIVIKYNLNKIDKYNYFDIKVTGMVEGASVPINSVTGDVGKLIKVGPDKFIKWNILDDVSELQGEFKVNVTATPNPEAMDIPTIPEKKVNKTPLWIGLGGSVAVGGALIVVGVLKISDGKDMHKTYKDHLYEYDEVFGDQSRQEYYDEANSKYNTGVILTSAGAVIAAAGGFYFINKLLKADKKGKVALNLIPIHDQLNGSYSAIPSGAVVSMTFKF